MEKKRSLIFYVFIISMLAIFFSYSLVFALPADKKANYKLLTNSNNIFLDSISLNSLVLLTNKDFKNFQITGECSLFGEFIGKSGSNNLFKLKVLDYDCKKDKIKVYFDFDGDKKEKIFNLISSYNLYSLNLDRSSDDINKMIKVLDLKIENQKNNILNLKDKRSLEEFNYLRYFLNNILEKRKQKYKIPIIGAKIPTKLHKIPNAGRPYRSSYTDGIHHGWDFDAEKGDSVISLDDGIVVKVIDGFLFSDLGAIKKSDNLTEEEKLKNLDILRGNQIWVKTMKGDVAFYSHLDSVFPGIKEGVVVSKGQPLGTVGSTGVPDKNYNDFHLHLPIQKNPYIKSKNGFYTNFDYMQWPWYFKGKSLNYVIENQCKIFE